MRVPEPYVDPLGSIAKLPAETYRRLLDELDTAQPTLTPLGAATSAAEASGLDVDDATRLLAALTSVSSLCRVNEWSVAELVDRLVQSEDLDIGGDKLSIFTDRTTQLLKARTVKLLGKAIEMSTESDKVFISARALTDLRPIFGDDLDDRPAGAVLTHTLKIEFVHEEGRLSNVYITLDEADLATLRKVLERAERKAATVRTVMAEQEISYLGPSS